MNITKVKINDEGVTVHFETEGVAERKRDRKRVEFFSPDEAHSDLHEAAQGVVAAVLARMELGVDSGHAITARFNGVSIKYDERYDYGYVATLLIERRNYVAPLVLNSPFVMHAPLDENTDDNAIMNGDEVDALEELLAEVKMYMSGEKRIQKDLFAEAA